MHTVRACLTRPPAASDDTPVADLPDKIPFFSGIPVVEVTRGVVHLFRDRYILYWFVG